MTKRVVIDMEDDIYWAEGKTIKLKDGKMYKIIKMDFVDVGNTWSEYDVTFKEIK